MTSACQVCTKPTDMFLCSRHRGELVEAWRDLATGGEQELRVHVIGTAHPTLPAGTAFGGARGLGQRAGLLEELEVTVTRQHRMGGGGIPAAGGSEPPLLFHEAASRLAHAARNSVGTWARDHAERHPHLTLPATHAAAAGWMAMAPGLLAEHPAAGEMYRDIVGLARRIRRVIDRAPDRVYLGQCGAEISLGYDPGLGYDPSCAVDIYADPDRGAVNCPGCGAVWDLRERREFLLDQVEDQLATATEASRALSALDVPCTAAMIRRYAHRGKLDQHPAHPFDPRQHPRYRIGDIRTLLAEVAGEGGSAA